MKKILLVVISTFVLFTLCGCIQLAGNDSVSSIAFVELPQKSILDTVETLSTKIVVVKSSGSKVYGLTITHEGLSFTEGEGTALDPGFTSKVSGNEYLAYTKSNVSTKGTLGNHTLIITIGNCTISHEYRIVNKDSDKLFTAGSGSTNDPYQITNAQELSNIRVYASSGYSYELMNDIDLTGFSWIPIGEDKTNKFEGLINGNGHTIKGLTNEGYQGIAKNMHISATGVQGYPFGLIGYARGNVTITKLTVEANINFKAGIGCAAFVGLYDNQDKTGTITFTECNSKGSISAQDKVAGFIGSTYITGTLEPQQDFVFEDCINYANITATIVDAKDKGRAGGIIGTWIEKSGLGRITFTDCENRGNVTGGNYNDQIYYGYAIGFIPLNGKTVLGTLDGITNYVDGLQKVGKNYLN